MDLTCSDGLHDAYIIENYSLWVQAGYADRSTGQEVERLDGTAPGVQREMAPSATRMPVVDFPLPTSPTAERRLQSAATGSEAASAIPTSTRQEHDNEHDMAGRG
jgi:hypothetical protein